MRRLFLVVPAALALAGCPASVNGEIDGESVPALMSAFFVQQVTGEGDFERTNVGAGGVTLLDGCNTFAKRQDNANIALEEFNDALDDAAGDPDKIEDAAVAQAENLVAYDEKNLPSDYWTVGLNLNAEDDGDFDGAESDIDVEDPDLDQDVIANVSICRTNDFPSEDDGAFEPDQDCWVAKEGTVTVNAFESETSVQITAEVTLIEQKDFQDGELDNDVGDVTITINAGFCQPLQDELDELNDIIEDAAGG